MSKYIVKNRVFCAGQLYEPGAECSETVALALGSDCEAVTDETTVEQTTSKKPIKKVSLK